MGRRTYINALILILFLFSLKRSCCLQALQPAVQETPAMTPKEEETPDTTSTQPSEKEKKKKKKKNKETEPSEETESPVLPDVRKEKKKKKKQKELEAAAAESVQEEMQVDPPTTKSKKNKKKTKNVDPENDQENKPSKDNKRKLEESMEVDEEVAEPSGKKQKKFDWDETITSLLTEKEEMKLNKLKKKCVAEFFAQNESAHQSPEEVGAKFDKKIKRKQYRILKDKVRLVPRHNEETTAAVEKINGATETNGATEINGASETNGNDKFSFNKWEAASLGNSAQTDKFRRLMGIKTDKPPEAIATKKRDDGKIFRDLENGFEKARNNHFKAKGKGLGFS